MVGDTRGDEEPPGGEGLAVLEVDGEAGVDSADDAIDERNAVAGDLGATGGEELAGRHTVARQVALHVGGRGVAGGAGVDDGDPTSGSPEDESGGQACGATADDHHVVGLGFHVHHLGGDSAPIWCR